MTIFKKHYKKYIDYLTDNRAELFAAWINPEILSITGLTAAQLMKGKIEIKKDLSFDEVVSCTNIIHAQLDFNVMFIKCVSAAIDSTYDEMYKKYGKKMLNGFYANEEKLQVPALISIMNEVRNEVVIEQKSYHQDLYERALKNLNAQLNLLASVWKLAEINIQEATLTSAHMVRKTSILDKIKTE